jgi:hypothetical protein
MRCKLASSLNSEQAWSERLVILITGLIQIETETLSDDSCPRDNDCFYRHRNQPLDRFIVISDQMSGLDVSLGLFRMKTIGINAIADDFIFVVGSRRYECPEITAQLLSPKVSLRHSIDPSMNEYVCQHDNSSEQFNSFMSLNQGSTIQVDESNCRSWLNFFL